MGNMFRELWEDLLFPYVLVRPPVMVDAAVWIESVPIARGYHNLIFSVRHIHCKRVRNHRAVFGANVIPAKGVGQLIVERHQSTRRNPTPAAGLIIEII